MPNVGTQVKDMEIRYLPGMSKEISVREAWEFMQENNAITLPMTDAENNLEGIISMSDITNNMMRHNPTSLSDAKTPFSHIAETLNGKILVGDEDAVFQKGKVLIGAGNPRLVKKYIEQGDLVILGDRPEDHLNAIEMQASCIVVGMDVDVSDAIRIYAKEKGTVVITTPHDSFDIARLIEQSVLNDPPKMVHRSTEMRDVYKKFKTQSEDTGSDAEANEIGDKNKDISKLSNLPSGNPYTDDSSEQ